MFIFAHRGEKDGVLVLPDKASLAVHTGETGNPLAVPVVKPDVVVIAVGLHIGLTDGKGGVGTVRGKGQIAEEFVFGEQVQGYFFHADALLFVYDSP